MARSGNDINLEAFKKKDAKVLAEIFKLQKKALIYFAEKLLGIRDEAENIVGITFMKLWEKHADFDSLPAIKLFLYTTTRDSCLDFLKYSRRLSDTQKDFRFWVGREDLMLHIMSEAELLSELKGDIKILEGSMPLYE